MINFQLHTLGGKQFWQDKTIFAGWRVQKNILSGHARLLDAENKRMAWGSYAHCQQQFNRYKLTNKIRPRSQHLALMVHGITRSTGTFSAMKRALIKAGYDAVAISYPSTRQTIEQHALALTELINRLEGYTTISFVTHSMGGLILRHVLAAKPLWQKTINLGAVVMIAPPNQGSVLAELVKNNILYKLIYGKSGQQLDPGKVKDMPMTKNIRLLIIAGRKRNGVRFNPIWDGDNDGTVKVSETILNGYGLPLIIPARHTAILKHPDTIKATVNYLLNHKSTRTTLKKGDLK